MGCSGMGTGFPQPIFISKPSMTLPPSAATALSPSARHMKATNPQFLPRDRSSSVRGHCKVQAQS